ncbi:MAG: DHHA1 domain-containing protein, partial [Spirochaetota bacterium]
SNVDLVDLVSRCSDLLVKFGGHKSAVGFTIDIENITSFRERINEVFQSEFDVVECQEIFEIDEVIGADDINFSLFSELSIFEPTGVGNRMPRFSILGTSVINPTPIGSEKNHIKFYIPSSCGIIPVIGWGLAHKVQRILEESPWIDIIFSIEDNFFRGEQSLQLNLHDARPSEQRPSSSPGPI